MNFEEQLQERVSRIETILEEKLPKQEGFQKTVLDAMDYSVMVGGKRLRPMLMLEAYRTIAGADAPTAPMEPLMAAMEMLHTYSLVHDDLPAMDNDEFRRGKLTTHKKYGHAMGILAGDGLLNYAYEVCAKAIITSGHKDRAAEAFHILADKAGIYGMVGGQTVDVQYTDKPMEKEVLQFVHELKTGALIQAAMMMGAVLAGASEEEVGKIEEAALMVGMAFQIQDDILDVTSTTEVLGKPVLSDEKNHKVTYVTLYGLEEAKRQVKEYSDRAAELLEGLNRKNEFLHELLMSLIYREK